MREQEPNRWAGWDIDGVAKKLGVLPELTRHHAFCEGVSLDVGPTDAPTHVELYPSAAVARFTSLDASIELVRTRPPDADERGILFASQAPDQSFSLVLERTGG